MFLLKKVKQLSWKYLIKELKLMERDLLKQKQTLIYILNKLSIADGEKSPEELSFISEIVKRFDLTDEKYLEAISSHFFELPKKEDDRLFFFFHSLQLIEIDKKITASEIELLKKVGFRLGLSPLIVNDLIDLYLTHLGEAIPSNRIPEILKKYLN